MDPGLALAAVNEIAGERKKLNGGVEEGETLPVEKTAYLVWSFKTPDELTTLRAIYRSRFFAIFSPLASRRAGRTTGTEDRGKSQTLGQSDRRRSSRSREDRRER